MPSVCDTAVTPLSLSGPLHQPQYWATVQGYVRKNKRNGSVEYPGRLFELSDQPGGSTHNLGMTNVPASGMLDTEKDSSFCGMFNLRRAHLTSLGFHSQLPSLDNKSETTHKKAVVINQRGLLPAGYPEC